MESPVNFSFISFKGSFGSNPREIQFEEELEEE
jgi:hypothetical protein